MVAHQMANGHHPQQQAFAPPQQQHGHPGGQYPIPSPAMSNHSLPGPNGSVPQQAPYPHQNMPYTGMAPYPDPNTFLHPHYQPQYPPQGPGPQFGNHYFPNQPHNQMGGPGPATIHNGYNAYHPNGYMPRQPVMGQPPQHQPGPQANGHDAMIQPHFNQFPPPGEGYYSHPSQPPPSFGQPDGHYQPNYYQAPPYPQHQPPVYPPGHPYSQGHGYGFSPQPMHHNGPNGHMYNGDHPPPPPVQNMQHSRPPPSTKSLNPTARGFVFRAAASQFPTPREGHQQPTTGTPNGGQTPTPASTVSLADTVSDTKPNGDHVADVAAAPPPATQGGGLGLSQMEPATSESTSAMSPASNKADAGMTPSMSRASGISSDTEGVVQTPEADAAQSDDAATPTSETAKTAQPAASPNSTIVPNNKASFGTAPKVQSQTPTPAGQRPYSIVQISRGRPSHDSAAGVTFDVRTLRTRPPQMSPVQTVHLELEPVDGKNGKKASPKIGKYLVSMGTGNDTPARIIDTSLVFGEITVEEIPAIVLRSPRVEKPSSEAPAKVEEATPKPEAAAPTPAPAPVPKAKPASWAALLKPTLLAQVPSDSLSNGPSSVRVSPSKSVISLATETDAVTEVDAITPRSVAPSLPPSASVPAPAARPVFNYASAAAAGRGLSPQEELVKLMTEGIKTRSKAPPASSIPRGLINTGNMCYANTILQMLAYCPPFSELLEELGKRIPADLARRQPLLEALISFLREFAPGPTSGSSTPSDKAKPNGVVNKGKAKDNKKYSGSEPFIPEDVYDALKGLSRFDALRRGQQEDAQEFLGWFIETLHEELLRIVSRTESSRSSSATRPQADGDAAEIARPVSPTGGWLEVGKKQKTNVVRNTETRESAVTRIFGGTLRSILHAPGQKDSVTLEPYQPIQLDIQSPNVKSITDALRAFNEPEPVPEYRSSKGVVAATKQVFIETFPPVLILHLKRFVYDHVAHDSVKKNKPIAYGTELVIPPEIISPAKRSASAVKYRLFGVDYHHGSSASGGHYTIAVSRQDAKGWIHFDDETYSTIAEEDVVVSPEDAESGKFGLVGGREKCAYLLFYQRVR